MTKKENIMRIFSDLILLITRCRNTLKPHTTQMIANKSKSIARMSVVAASAFDFSNLAPISYLGSLLRPLGPLAPLSGNHADTRRQSSELLFKVRAQANAVSIAVLQREKDEFATKSLAQAGREPQSRLPRPDTQARGQACLERGN